MKKSILVVLLVMQCFIISCSDIEDSCGGYYTEAEYCQIMNLAKEYGVDFHMNSRHYDEKVSIQEFEDLFATIQASMGTFSSKSKEMFFYQDNEGETKGKAMMMISSDLNTRSALPSIRETHNANTSKDQNNTFLIRIQLSWDEVDNVIDAESAKVTGSISCGMFSGQSSMEFPIATFNPPSNNMISYSCRLIYTLTNNSTFTFAVSGSYEIGNDNSWKVEITTI